MTTTESRPATPVRAAPPAPLQPEDPPRVGSFWLRTRLAANAAGYVYAGQDDEGVGAVVVMMTEGSADDAAARDRFRHAVEQLPEEAVIAQNSPDDDDLALWIALGPLADGDSTSAADARRIAERYGDELLSAVLMDKIPHMGRKRGPDFLHYWESRRRPGLFRLWPLPWPTSLRAASRLALMLSLLTMLVLMLAALFIAWLLFRNQPEVDPGPVIPTSPGTVTVTVTPTTPPPSSPPPSPPPSGTPTGTPSPSPTGGTETPTPGGTPQTPGPVDPAQRY